MKPNNTMKAATVRNPNGFFLQRSDTKKSAVTIPPVSQLAQLDSNSRK
jgi:hypothetical protein